MTDFVKFSKSTKNFPFYTFSKIDIVKFVLCDLPMEWWSLNIGLIDMKCTVKGIKYKGNILQVIA
jgi:hypothetical protein